MYEEREKAMAENMFRRNKNVVKPRQSYLYRDVQFDDLISEYFMVRLNITTITFFYSHSLSMINSVSVCRSL